MSPAVLQQMPSYPKGRKKCGGPRVDESLFKMCINAAPLFVVPREENVSFYIERQRNGPK